MRQKQREELQAVLREAHDQNDREADDRQYAGDRELAGHSEGVGNRADAGDTMRERPEHAQRVGQALEYLLDNAVRAVSEGGAVTLSAEAAPSEVRIRVEDTGRGIPYHLQAHVFDRFVRRERGGPGVGLALVKALVELHGGWVALESEPGAGSTFTCHLPETQQPGAMQPELSF